MHSESDRAVVHPQPIPAAQSCAFAAQNVNVLSATSISSLAGGIITGRILSIGNPPVLCGLTE